MARLDVPVVWELKVQHLHCPLFQQLVEVMVALKLLQALEVQGEVVYGIMLLVAEVQEMKEVMIP
jgi:hypothetical protein